MVQPKKAGTAVKIAKFRIIETQTWKTRDYLACRIYGELNPGGKQSNKIKVEVTRDSSDSQSHARGFVFSFNTMTWNNIYSIPYPKMKSLKINIYDTCFNLGVVDPSHFTGDALDVIAGMESILF